MKYVLFALLAWFLFQLIFKLVIPVYKTTRKIKKGFREMQEKMNAQYQQQQAPSQPQGQSNGKVQVPKEDYLDFEEVK